ncbi:MAG: hypothetical protein ACRDGM_02040, partial [bacterium]
MGSSRRLYPACRWDYLNKANLPPYGDEIPTTKAGEGWPEVVREVVKTSSGRAGGFLPRTSPLAGLIIL